MTGSNDFCFRPAETSSMSTGTRSPPETEAADPTPSTPVITACESRPGRTVLIESDNTDGWLSSDLTLDAVR